MGAAERVGAQTKIRLADLSIFNSPPRERVMAVLKGYFDDSRSSGKIWTLAGYVGGEREWELFEYLWVMTMQTHGVPYFHMKEFGDPEGVYKKWQPPEEHYDEVADFFSQLTKAIGYSALRGFGASVRENDLRRFNEEKGLNLDAYSLATYSNMLFAGHQYPDQPIELFFDRVEQVHSKLECAETYAASDTYYPGVADKVQLIPVAKGLTFKEIVPLQAGDFAAWELRKNHLTYNEWFDIEDKPIEWGPRWEHLKQWSQTKFGTQFPTGRKSFFSLFTRSALDGIVWDYRAMCIAHEARGGVWA